MINNIWIREKLLSSKKYWSKLEEIILKTSEDLEMDIDLQLKAERIFEILSQILLDICTHIIAHTREPPPQTYSDCMKKLGNLGVITAQTAEKATSLVKMRNIVVHQYDNINYRLLFKGLCELFEDFPLFQEEILTWIDSQREK
ncbi:MAG: DUF86 domain-containing protein [Candidatus Lokiarchaeota archaeon]|nr:DUF86 domain-containing protein [Candidatus Lokiarchaeota archaeon]